MTARTVGHPFASPPESAPSSIDPAALPAKPGPPPPRAPLRLLITFSPDDRALEDLLVRQLAILRHLEIVEIWSRDRVRGGGAWREEAERARDHADVALLLISASFLASEALMNEELPRIFDQQKKRGLRVIPVLLAACLWDAHPGLGALRPLPRSGVPIASLDGDDRDQALKEIAAEIAELTEAGPVGASGRRAIMGARPSLRRLGWPLFASMVVLVPAAIGTILYHHGLNSGVPEGGSAAAKKTLFNQMVSLVLAGSSYFFAANLGRRHLAVIAAGALVLLVLGTAGEWLYLIASPTGALFALADALHFGAPVAFAAGVSCASVIMARKG